MFELIRGANVQTHALMFGESLFNVWRQSPCFLFWRHSPTCVFWRHSFCLSPLWAAFALIMVPRHILH